MNKLYKEIEKEIMIELDAAKSLGFLGVLCLNLQMPSAASYFFGKASDDLTSHTKRYEEIYQIAISVETNPNKDIMYPFKLFGKPIQQHIDILLIVEAFFELEKGAVARIAKIQDLAINNIYPDLAIKAIIDELIIDHTREATEAKLIIRSLDDIFINNTDKTLSKLDNVFKHLNHD